MASVFQKLLVLLNQRGYDGRMDRWETRKLFWSESMEGKEYFRNVGVQVRFLIKFSV